MTTNGATVLEPTPIFDAVMQEQGVEMMPLPATPTHEEFLSQRDHAEWLALVLGDDPQPGERPRLNTPPAQPRPVPTKRNKGQR